MSAALAKVIDEIVSALDRGDRTLAEEFAAAVHVDEHHAAWNARNDALCVAARYGVESVVALLLHAGCPVNACDNEGRTALHYAVSIGHDGLVQRLLDAGADVNVVDDHNEFTPLMYAACDDRVQLAEILLRHSARVDLRDAWGCTALDHAATNGNQRLCQLLVTHGADPTSALAHAARQGHLPVCGLLIDQGARTDAGSDGHSAMVEASREGQVEVCRFLAAHGVAVDDADREGRTPLHLAGSPDICDVLVSHGARLDRHDNIGRTALAAALDRGRRDVAARLLALGARVDDGPVPLLFVVLGDYLIHDIDDETAAASCELLLQAGADPNTRHHGDTPLHCSAKLPKVCQRLLAHHASVSARNDAGDTPLLHAATRGSSEVVRYLLDHGADINDLSSVRSSALHLALERLNYDVARLLVERGVSLSIQDIEGRTPLHLSVRVGNEGITRLLLARGASVDTQDVGGLTPLHYSVRSNEPILTHLLLETGASALVRDLQGTAAIDLVPGHWWVLERFTAAHKALSLLRWRSSWIYRLCQAVWVGAKQVIVWASPHRAAPRG